MKSGQAKGRGGKIEQKPTTIQHARGLNLEPLKFVVRSIRGLFNTFKYNPVIKPKQEKDKPSVSEVSQFYVLYS